MVEEKFEDVCANIRACLNSSKRQISINELNRDYHSVIGSYIPFRKHNYNSLDDFIRAVPNLKLSRIGNELYVDVKVDERTKHITDFVRSQKTSKKSKGRGGKSRSLYRNQPIRQTSDSTRNWSTSRNNSYYSSSNNNYTSSNSNNNSYKKYNPAPKRYSPEEQDYARKYRSSRPSALDFSEDEFDEFSYDEDSICDDEYYSLAPPAKPAVEVQSAIDNFKNLEITVNRPRSGRGFGSRGGIAGRETSSRPNSFDDDVGYSSMKSDHFSSSSTGPEANIKDNNSQESKARPSFIDSRYCKNRLAILHSRCNQNRRAEHEWSKNRLAVLYSRRNQNHAALPDGKVNTGREYSAQNETTIIDLTSPDHSFSSHEPDDDHSSVRPNFKDSRCYQTRPAVRSSVNVNNKRDGHEQNDSQIKSSLRQDDYYGEKNMRENRGLIITVKNDCRKRLVEVLKMLSSSDDD